MVYYSLNLFLIKKGDNMSSINLGNMFRPILENKANDNVDTKWRTSLGTGLENLKTYEFNGKKYTVVKKEERELSWKSGTRWLALATSIFSLGIVPLCFSDSVKNVLLGKQFRLIVKEQQNPTSEKVSQQQHSTLKTDAPSANLASLLKETATKVTTPKKDTTVTPQHPYVSLTSLFGLENKPNVKKGADVKEIDRQFTNMNADLDKIAREYETRKSEVENEDIEKQFIDMEAALNTFSKEDELEEQVEILFARYGILDPENQEKIVETFREAESNQDFTSKIRHIQNQNKYPPKFTTDFKEVYSKLRQE